MRTKTLLIASLLAACPAAWAEQSALEALGTKTVEQAAKSALPAEAKQAVDAASTAKKVLDKGPDALEKKALGIAEQKALGAAKSALPAEAKQAVDAASTAKKVLDKGPDALEKKAVGMAQQKALGAATSALPGQAKDAVKATEQATSAANQAKKVEGMVANPADAANKAVKSAEDKAKKKAMDSALDMLH